MWRAMLHTAGPFAEFEREISRERVKAGPRNAERALVNVQKVRR